MNRREWMATIAALAIADKLPTLHRPLPGLLGIIEDGSTATTFNGVSRYIETAEYFDIPVGIGARHEDDHLPVPPSPFVNVKLVKRMMPVDER